MHEHLDLLGEAHRRMCVLDPCTRVSQAIDCLSHDCQLVAVDRTGGVVEPGAHAKVAGRDAARGRQL